MQLSEASGLVWKIIQGMPIEVFDDDSGEIWENDTWELVRSRTEGDFTGSRVIGSANLVTALNILHQKLIIKSEEGTIVYKELLDKSGTYRKEFDLTSLPNGRYYSELDKDLEIQIIPFIVQNTKVNFKKENTRSIYKPIVTTKENVVSINKLALNLEPLEINIYYDSGNHELIHTEKIKDKNNIQRVYRLLKSVNGKYKVVCTTQGRTFTTFFEF